MRPIGRIKTKLAELLRAQGLDIQPEDFWVNMGGNSHRKLDLARWGAWFYRENVKCHIHSWDTMTVCVKHGIEVEKEGGWEYQAYCQYGK